MQVSYVLFKRANDKTYVLNVIEGKFKFELYNNQLYPLHESIVDYYLENYHNPHDDIIIERVIMEPFNRFFANKLKGNQS